MVRIRELTLERDGFAARDLVLLLAGVLAVAAVVAFVVAGGRERVPAGTIGYRNGEIERWVNARGKPVTAPESGTAVIAPALPFETDLGPAQFWSPDGDAVAFVTTTDEGAWQISRLLVKEGGRVREVGQIGGGDGPALLLTSKGGARSRDGVPLVVAWSPDGRQLAWGSVTSAPYNLHLTDRATLTPRSLPLAGGYAGELAWSPDGRYLAISTYAPDRTDHTILLLDTTGHEAPRQVAKGCVMVWSPDSRYLALHGEPKTQPGLWVVSVDGKARQIIDRLGLAPFAWTAR